MTGFSIEKNHWLLWGRPGQGALTACSKVVMAVEMERRGYLGTPTELAGGGEEACLVIEGMEG